MRGLRVCSFAYALPAKSPAKKETKLELDKIQRRQAGIRDATQVRHAGIMLYASVVVNFRNFSYLCY